MFTANNRREIAHKTAWLLKVLFVLNMIWDVVFVAGSLYLFGDHTVYIALTLFITMMMTQELFFYVKDMTANQQEVKWYLKHYNTLTILCMTKFTLLVWFAFMYLVDAADIHVLHILLYLTDEAALCLSLLLFVFFVIAIIAFYVAPKHQRVIYDVAAEEDLIQ